MSISPKTEELVRRLLSERFASRMNGATHVIYNPTLNQTKMALDDKTTLATKTVRSNAKKKKAMLDNLRRRGQRRRAALRH
jgi:hypothetical protein